MSRNVVVIGQGYVGLPMALAAMTAGHAVRGLDSNPAVVDALNRGISHVDDVSDRDLASAVEAGFRATSDPAALRDADVVLVCVPTPLAANGGPDLGSVLAAAEVIAAHVQPESLVVLESTTFPGTTEDVFAPVVCAAGFTPGLDINIAFSPERVDPGNTSYGVTNTPKVIGGVTASCAQRAADFYGGFVGSVVIAKGAREAELSKLIENTFRHVNIALVNEMARFSHDLGIDLWDAIALAETKPFGFMAFRPGPGVGGHCIPIDPNYLSHYVREQLGYPFRLVETAEVINASAPKYVATRIRQRLEADGLSIGGAKVLLLGVTYKADVADCRETPASDLAMTLREWGASIIYVDPLIDTWTPAGAGTPMKSEANAELAIEESDICVLLQAHSGFDLDLLVQRARRILDTRHVVPAGEIVEYL